MSAPLGPTQLLTLLALNDVEEGEAPPTAAELVEKITGDLIANGGDWEPYYRRNPMTASAVNGALRGLGKRALVERLGLSATNARCWEINEDGRQALKKAARS